MAALTQDAIRKTRGPAGKRGEYAIKTSSRIFLGSLVAQPTASRRVVAATAATGRRVAGVCVGFTGAVPQVTDGKGGATGNADGTIRAVVEWDREFEFAVETALRTSSNVKLNVFVGDDNEVAGVGVGSAGTRIPVGQLTEFTADDESAAWVHVGAFYTTNVAT